jgi:hypothetical protein
VCTDGLIDELASQPFNFIITALAAVSAVLPHPKSLGATSFPSEVNVPKTVSKAAASFDPTSNGRRLKLAAARKMVHVVGG